MPSKSRKKQPPSKRLNITDDSGWTHVTPGGRSAARVLRTTSTDSSHDHNQEQKILPAETPSRVTLEDLRAQFSTYKIKWEQSGAWDVVRGVLRDQYEGQGQHELGNDRDNGNDEQDKYDKRGQLPDSIISIGLGSPSGLSRGGWIDRRSVSMYQLAALVSIGEYIRSLMSTAEKTTTQPPQQQQPEPEPELEPKTKPILPIYAQDPIFNTHDKALLSSLGITVLPHPEAFRLATSQTFLFCPGAEKTHLEELASRDPAVLFGGPLEDVESGVVREYLARRESRKIPEFRERGDVFWGMRIYYNL